MCIFLHSGLARTLVACAAAVVVVVALVLLDASKKKKMYTNRIEVHTIFYDIFLFLSCCCSSSARLSALFFLVPTITAMSIQEEEKNSLLRTENHSDSYTFTPLFILKINQSRSKLCRRSLDVRVVASIH